MTTPTQPTTAEDRRSSADPASRPPAAAVAPRRMVSLVLHQFRYDLRRFWRNTQARFFTLALPVLFLLIFASVFGNSTVHVPGGTIKESVYYVPGIISLGVISATFQSLVMSVTAARQSGIYKRRRATPVPAGVIIAGQALQSMVVALAITVLLFVLGWAIYGASVPVRTLPALLLTVVTGAAAFCCLGFALTGVIRNSDAAQPVLQVITLPLYFISGVFVSSSFIPHWLTDVANVFPVRHLATALLAAYNPHTGGTGVRFADLAVLVAWGAAGLAVAIRNFTWLPNRSSS